MPQCIRRIFLIIIQGRAAASIATLPHPLPVRTALKTDEKTDCLKTLQTLENTGLAGAYGLEKLTLKADKTTTKEARSRKTQDLASKTAQTTLKQQKKTCISASLLELIPGFEPGTSSLPKCTRTRRNERINVIKLALYEHSYSV